MGKRSSAKATASVPCVHEDRSDGTAIYCLHRSRRIKSDAQAPAYALFANVRKEERLVPAAMIMGDPEVERKLFRSMKDVGIRRLSPRYPKWQKAVKFLFRGEVPNGPLSHLPKEKAWGS